MSTKSRYCSSCGQSTKRAASKLLIITSLIALLCISVFLFLGANLKQLLPKQEVATEVVKEEPKKEKVEQTKVEPKKEAAQIKQPLVETPKDVSDIINTSQPKVFTIFTELGQGSGFLINKNGDVLTNAHVVEGSLNPVVKTIDGKELQSTLIGYSNTTDIAVIRVQALANKEPFQLDETTHAEIGEEVIALGSPQGLENTATLGNISGVDRTFVIDPFYYDGIYQTSAPIAPGSSGGPLVSKKTGKVIAINSARHTQEVNIGFSIPLYQVMETINQWINSPMTEDEITSLFYYEEGVYYYQDYLDDSGYFEGGNYNEDYFEYYEIPYDESWYEESSEIDESYDYEDYGSAETDESYNYEDYGSTETDESYDNEDYESSETDEYDEYEDNSSVNEYEESGDYQYEEEYIEEDNALIEEPESSDVGPSDSMLNQPIEEDNNAIE
jgi:S1-C subfamily serine protease